MVCLLFIMVKKLEESNRKNSLHLEADKKRNADIQEAENTAASQRNECTRKINAKKAELIKREGEVKLAVGSTYENAKKTVTDLEAKIKAKQEEINRFKGDKSSLEADVLDAQKNVSDTEATIKEKESEITDLRAEFQKIYAEEFIMDPTQMVCPTCKRPLDMDDLEAKRQELEANFNSQKAERIKANQEKGKATREKLENLTATQERQRKTLQDKDAKLKQAESDITNSENELTELNRDLVSARASVPAEWRNNGSATNP